jgi:hypothetical protein
VLNVEPIGSGDDSSQKWMVKIHNYTSGTTEDLIFDAVVVASGYIEAHIIK